MINITRRLMTVDERSQLKRALASDSFGPWYLNVGFGAALLVLPMLLLTALLHQKRLQEMLLPIAAGVGAAIGLYFHVKGRRLLAPARASTRSDIREGSVEQVDALVQEAACIPEFEDEGPAVFLSVGPDATLFLQGQYLSETGEAGELLRTRVSTARAPLSRTILEFRTSGDEAPSLTLLPAGIYEGLPDDGELVRLPLRDAITRYARAKSAQGRRRRRTRG